MQFAGKVGLVTGGGSGIGKATAELLAKRGGAVVVADIHHTAGAATADGIRRAGGRAEAVECDVTVWDQVQAAVDRARKEFGGLDIIVNCAGVGGTSRASWPTRRTASRKSWRSATVRNRPAGRCCA